MKEFPTGFRIIKEMSREQLIDEVLINQRAQLEEMDIPSLRHAVADFRIKEMTKRIHTEAGLKFVPGILGGAIVEDDE